MSNKVAVVVFRSWLLGARAGPGVTYHGVGSKRGGDSTVARIQRSIIHVSSAFEHTNEGFTWTTSVFTLTVYLLLVTVTHPKLILR